MSNPLGVFIVIEGPNGVGKTTVSGALSRQLLELGTPVHTTAEPTSSPFGQAIRAMEASMPAIALALGCAADRYDHLSREISPRLAEGVWVVCDRYVPSSLVLQRLDGFDLEWIWSLNKGSIQPDLTVYLEHDPEAIQAQLDQRGRRSRFETEEKVALELHYYREARAFLAGQSWRQTVIDCRSHTPVQIADQIRARLP